MVGFLLSEMMELARGVDWEKWAQGYEYDIVAGIGGGYMVLDNLIPLGKAAMSQMDPPS